MQSQKADMTLRSFFDSTNLDKTFVIGYYGGGNFGDELLLEVILHKFTEQNIKQARFWYKKRDLYRIYHRNFSYQQINGSSKFLSSLITSRSITIGGGGLWGMDVNLSILALSLLLFLAHLILRKKVYLIGVGYYDSTSRKGKLAGWLAGKAANIIIARDQESYNNFRNVNKNTYKDKDIAFLIEDIDLSIYDSEANKIRSELKLFKDMVFISLRKFEDERGDKYYEAIKNAVREQNKTNFVVSLLQIEYPAGIKNIKELAGFSNVQILNTKRNPLAIFRFFQKQATNFRFIVPQYHAIVMAQICGIKYLPIAYDNKVRQLLSNKTSLLSINEITNKKVISFIA